MAAGELAEIALPNDATAPGLARRFISDHSDGIANETVADAELLASELVTNALQHGHPSITLRLCTDPPGIGVSVQDGGSADQVSPRTPRHGQPDGRGLMIVDAVAAEWGVIAEDPPPGKTVWFRLGVG